MMRRESARIQQALKETSKAASSSRGMGNSQFYFMLILVLGFLLVVSYQYETHFVDAGSYTPVVANVSKSLTTPNLGTEHLDAKVESRDTSRPREEEEVLALSAEKAVHSTLTHRKLEWQDNTSSESPSPPAKTKRDESWKDHKIEAYVPLVESVQSNILSIRFRLVIKVLALNNYSSLARCLSSLSKADYAGDPVDIHIYIDHFDISEAAGSQRRLLTEALEMGARSTQDDLGEETGGFKKTVASKTTADRIFRIKDASKNRKISSSRSRRKLGGQTAEPFEEARVPDRVETGTDSVKQSDWELVEQRLGDARKVVEHAEYFQWKHGNKVIHYRTKTAGSQSQWLDAWWPSSDDEFALFVEDDAEVSPLYYRYVRSLIATYYYNWTHYDNSLYGISLQRPQIVPGKNGRPIQVDERTRLFKYQMVGIWGQVFFPKPWKEFRMWYDRKKSHDMKPIVGGMVTTDWYKQFGEKMFTPWFVKFAYSRGYFNLYTNFLRDRVLSVTHRDGGIKTKKYAGCDSVLIFKNGTYDIDIWHMAANWHIKRYDYCFREVRAGRFANYSRDVSWILDSAQQDNKILVVSTVGVPEELVKNWLCHIRKVGVENYILVGEDPVLLEDLARRGHATMRIENKDKLEEDTEKETSAVLVVLEHGHDVWFTRADTLWVGNPLAVVDVGDADVIGLENPQLNLFFIRSTEETKRFWGSLNQELTEVPSNVSRLDNWERAREKFLKTCQDEDTVKTRPLQEVVFIDGDKLDQPSTLENAEGSSDAQVLVFSDLQSSYVYEMKNKIAHLNLWNLDDDLACAQLIC